MKYNIPYAKDDKLPTFDAIVKGFEEIDSTDLTSLTFEEIKKLFLDNIRILPQIIAPEGKINLPLYRVTDGKFSGFDKSRPASFSHPPKEVCKKGRANIEGYPVLYTSFQEDTAFREFRDSNGREPTVGESYYLSEWKVNENVEMKFAQFIYSESFEMGELTSYLNNAMHEKFDRMSMPYSDDKKRAMKFLIEKLSGYFINAKDYSASSFIGHYTLFDGRESAPLKADAIMYPSIKANLHTVNLAVHPEFVKQHLELSLVKKIAFGGFQKDGSQITYEEFGVPDGTSISWFKINLRFLPTSLRNIFLSFSTTPTFDRLPDAASFYRNGHQLSLRDLALDILHENKLQLIQLLVGVKQKSPSDNSQSQLITIVPTENSVLSKVNGAELYVDQVMVEIDCTSVVERL